MALWTNKRFPDKTAVLRKLAIGKPVLCINFRGEKIQPQNRSRTNIPNNC